MAHHHARAHGKKVPSAKKDPFDWVIYFFAFAAPVFELPQLTTIFQARTSDNVSWVTWGFFSLASFAWLVYAIRRRLKPLIISYLLFFIVEFATFIAIVIYR